MSIYPKWVKYGARPHSQQPGPAFYVQESCGSTPVHRLKLASQNHQFSPFRLFNERIEQMFAPIPEKLVSTTTLPENFLQMFK